MVAAACDTKLTAQDRLQSKNSRKSVEVAEREEDQGEDDEHDWRSKMGQEAKADMTLLTKFVLAKSRSYECHASRHCGFERLLQGRFEPLLGEWIVPSRWRQ